MFQKVNNKILGIVFVILLLIGAFIFVFDGGKTEITFREVLVDIDTSKVTEILIYPKSQNHKEVKLFKDKDEWRVNLPSGGDAKVVDQRISSLFSQLLAIIPKRPAARDESKWNELQVDSTGSRVKVFEGSKLSSTIFFTVRISREIAAGRDTLRAKLEVQACNDQICIAPATIDVLIPMEIVPADRKPKRINDDIFSPYIKERSAPPPSGRSDRGQ